MTADLKPYPARRDSGVPWLGEVPVGWEIRRNGRLFAQRNETGFPDLPILEVSLRTGVRVRDFDASARKQVMADRAKYKRAADGDIAYNMMRMWQGAVGVVPIDGLISPAYVVARPFPGTVPGYFAYLYRTDSYMGEVDNYSRGIVKDRNRLYWEQFKQIPTPYPPPAEQSAIVRFLGYAERRIRRYIRAKQKLIKLLEEQKQAIIHRAVTRGLDPNVRLRPSGVEWLGDVPEHWNVRAFTRCAIERADYRGATPTKTDSGVFLVTAKNIRKGWIDYKASQEFVSRHDYPTIMRRGLPRVGDLLLTTEAPLGNAALVDRDDVALAQRVIRFRMDPNLIDSKFALYLVLSPYFQRQLLQRGTGSTALGIKASKLPQLQIFCPPLAEQAAILD
jgi:type I restriction enzyme S subunit